MKLLKTSLVVPLAFVVHLTSAIEMGVPTLRDNPIPVKKAVPGESKFPC